MLLLTLIIGLLGYSLGIIFDIIYLKTGVFSFHVAYWIFFVIGFCCNFICATLNILKIKKKQNMDRSDNPADNGTI